MCFDEAVDGGLKFFIIKSVGKSSFNRAFSIVLDSHAVAESDEKLLLPFHEVNLKEVFADGVAGFEFKSLMKPDDLLCDRFFLNEDRSEISVCGEGRDR